MQKIAGMLLTKNSACFAHSFVVQKCAGTLCTSICSPKNLLARFARQFVVQTIFSHASCITLYSKTFATTLHALSCTTKKLLACFTHQFVLQKTFCHVKWYCEKNSATLHPLIVQIFVRHAFCANL